MAGVEDVRVRPILFINGVLLIILSLSMVLPMLSDFYFGYEDWKVFFACIIVTAFFGGALVLSSAGQDFSLSIREAFLLAVSSWILLAGFAALPFWFSSLKLTVADSFFEAMSGLSTTGATILSSPQDAPAGILLWRAMLQWLGGIGVIVLSVSLLPFLNIGGMQIFRSEYSDSEKVFPRTMQLVSNLFTLYLGLTVLCALSYMASGFEIFDAVAHSMTTISTGGFSTFNHAFSDLHNPGAEFTAILFMVLGSLPFVLYLKALRGRPAPLFRDGQVHWFLFFILACSIVVAVQLYRVGGLQGSEALRVSLFHTVSIITGTGYYTTNFSAWGGVSLAVLFFLMALGGCSGSSASGIKIFRFQILYAVAKTQMGKLMYPHGVFIPYYARKPVPPSVPASVMSFFFLFALSFSVIAILLSLTGLDLVTSLSASAACLSNVGPGFGPIVGPYGSYAPLSDGAKWVLSFAMLLGRLEIFTVLILLTPYFWKH